MVYYVFSLESPQWGDSNESTQCDFMIKKIKNLFLLCPRTWCYEQHSLARTTPVPNIISWFQRCSSHWSATVLGQLGLTKQCRSRSDWYWFSLIRSYIECSLIRSYIVCGFAFPSVSVGALKHCKSKLCQFKDNYSGKFRCPIFLIFTVRFCTVTVYSFQTSQ